MKRIVIWGMTVVIVALTGCSKDTGPKTMRVWGEVSFDGKPVDDGMITFEAADGAAPAQGQIKAGHYEIPTASGPVAEKTYIVKVNAQAKTGKTIKNIMGDGEPTMDVMVETIPATFNVNSAIKKSISPEPDKNHFEFKLMPTGTYE